MLFSLRAIAQDPQANLADFDQLWQFTRDQYCCFQQKATDWEKARALHRVAAARATDKRQLIRVFEDTLDELYDAHSHLAVNLSSSWRLPAYDIWAERHHGRAVVLEVRADSAAARSGISAGMEITRVDDQSIDGAIRNRMPHSLKRLDRRAREWALLSVLAGHHDRARRFTVRDRNGAERVVTIEEVTMSEPGPVVSWKALSPRLGYIRISSFEDQAAIAEFDRALDALRSSAGLIIDVRNNHGGDTAVSRPIMARFLKQRQQYAWMARRDGEKLGRRWPEYVDPRGPWTYQGKVVVLVDHFTDSTAEGFAMGMDGMKRATVVGTPMGHLGAATARVTLTNSQVTAQISAEPVYHLNGQPRDAFRPRIAVDLATCKPDADCTLDAAIRALSK